MLIFVWRKIRSLQSSGKLPDEWLAAPAAHRVEALRKNLGVGHHKKLKP